MKDERNASCVKQSQMIEAAVEVFQEKGFHSASMDQISLRAAVSKRTLYKHFESKENLYASIVARLSERVTDTLDVRYNPSLDIRSQLMSLALAEGALFTSPEVMAMSRMIISETLRNPELAKAAQGKVDNKSSFVALLDAAARDGTLRIPDPHVAAEEFVALLKAKAFWPVVFGGDLVTPDEMARIADEAVEMMMCRYGQV